MVRRSWLPKMVWDGGQAGRQAGRQAGNRLFLCWLVCGGPGTAVGLPVRVPSSGWGFPLMASRCLLAATSEMRHMMHEFRAQGFFKLV